MSDLLLTVLLALHLMLVNVAMAGPLVCLWFEWRDGRRDVLAARAGRFLANASVVALLVGMGLGVIVGWLVWSPAYKAALSYLSPRITSGLGELAFSLVLMAIYAVWFSFSRAPSAWQRVVRGLLALLAATNLMYHFPFLFVILAKAVGQNEIPVEPLQSSQFLRLIVEPDILSRTVHFWLASLAMTGVVLMIYGVMLMRRADDEDDGRRIGVWGGRIALVPTVLQLPVGVWVMLSLPQDVQKNLMGGNMIGSLLLAVSILLALWLMHQLSSISFGKVTRRSLTLTIGLMIVVVVLMTGTSRFLKPTGSAVNLFNGKPKAAVFFAAQSPSADRLTIEETGRWRVPADRRCFGELIAEA